MDITVLFLLTMWKHLNLLICIIMFKQCVLTSTFFFSSDKQLILIPSVAFRYHLNANVNAHPSDDWILHAQGRFYFIDNSIEKKCLFQVGFLKKIDFVQN
jgi:hypothetical protein